MNKIDEQLFIRAYLEAVKFTEELNLSVRWRLQPAVIKKLEKSCLEFVPRAVELCPEIDWNNPELVERAAHDFWFTRNEHGAGFWDGDWPEEAGKKLTVLAKEFGVQYSYVGDDGKIYFEGGR